MPGQDLQKKYDSLPEDLKKALFDENISKQIENVAISYEIDDELIEEFLKITGKVFLGILPLQNLAIELSDSFNLKTHTAQQIVNDLKIAIFSKHKEGLDKIYPKSLLELARKKQLLKQKYQQILEEKQKKETAPEQKTIESQKPPAIKEETTQIEKTTGESKTNKEKSESQEFAENSTTLAKMKNNAFKSEKENPSEKILKYEALEGKNLIEKIAVDKKTKKEEKPKTKQPADRTKKPIDQRKNEILKKSGEMEKKDELFKKGPDKYREPLEKLDEEEEDIRPSGIVKEENGKIKTIL